MSYDDEGQLQVPTNYIATLFRYKYYLAFGIALLMGLSAVVVTFVPSVYRSEAVVLVETQQIPQDLVKSTVTSVAAQQIQIIKQRVMTRQKLLSIANKYPVLKDDSNNVIISSLITDMREAITVEPISDGRRRGAVTIAFKLAFDSRDPKTAQAVTNDLVTLFLDENVKSRTERATETTDFLKSEADKLKQKLAQTEQAIADYKQKHKDALPEHLDLYMSMLERAQNSRVEIQRQVEGQRSQRSFFEVQLTSSPGGQSDQSRAQELYKEFERLTSIYKENHPDVLRVKDEIDNLDKAQSATKSSSGLIEQKIAATNSQISLLSQQLLKTNNQIQDLEAKILKIPQVERGLLTLNRDYLAVKGQYDQVLHNTMQAQMAESLEQGRKAERFSILEPPLLPDQPHSPDRKKLIAAGLGASVSIPFVIVLLLGFLDKSVRGAAAVEAITGSAPLVVVPLITTKEEVSKRKRWRIKVVAAVVLSVVGAVVLVHFVVMPLDMLLYKLMFKFGLS